MFYGQILFFLASDSVHDDRGNHRALQVEQLK